MAKVKAWRVWFADGAVALVYARRRGGAVALALDRARAALEGSAWRRARWLAALTVVRVECLSDEG